MSAVSEQTPVRPMAVVGPRTIAELARAEARYALRNPLLWAGALLYAGLSWWPLLDGEVGRPAYALEFYYVWDWGAGPFIAAAFIAGNWAALRERPATTAELFANTPAGRWERTLGLLGAAAVPAGMSLVIGSVTAGLIARAGGLAVGEQQWTTYLTPTPLELLGAPLAAGCAFVAGIALARVIRSRAVGAVVGVVGWMFLFGMFWVWYLLPFAPVAVLRSAPRLHDLGTDPTVDELNSWPAIDPPDEFDPQYFGIDRDLGFFALHLGFVVGLAAVLAGIALLRSGRDRRSWWVLGVGLVVAVAAVVWQLVAHVGPLEIGEYLL